jgi:hypothetical protein
MGQKTGGRNGLSCPGQLFGLRLEDFILFHKRASFEHREYDGPTLPSHGV